VLTKIKQALTDRCLWAKGEPLLVGVSGGPDSVALLDALAQLQPEFGPLTVCHLNHQLRGAASDADEEFVRYQAARYGVRAEVRARDVQQLASERKISVEMAAREARLDFFQEVAHATGIWKIALAHTADDQAETVLLRLIRGAGREGLSAMEPLARQRNTLVLVRPMLRMWRAEVENYLREQKLSCREDATNRDVDFLRNRVRHTLLPLLEREFNLGIKPVLLRTAEILGEEEAFLDALADEELRGCADGELLRAQDLMLLDTALQRRVVRRWLAQWLPLSELAFERVEAVLRMAAESAGSAQVEVAKDVSVVREYGALHCLSAAAVESQPPLGGEELLPVPGTVESASWGWWFSAEVVSRDEWESAMRTGLSAESLVAFFDVTALCAAPLAVRGWRDGDRFQPLGMSEEKKLQDFFVDEKVPRSQRDRVPLVLCGGRIAWVVGHRIAEWAKVIEVTKNILKLTAGRLHITEM
jgi:tRNA(Ile)-lysidine synthase